MKVYFMVMKRGLPIHISAYYDQAARTRDEMSTTGAPCEIVTVTPVQSEFEFEDPTNPEITL